MRNVTKLCSAFAGAVLMLLLAVPARAGDINVVGHFENGGITAEIDTYSEGGIVVAMLVFKKGDQAMTFAFDRLGWPGLDRLWQTARQVRGAKFVSAGSLAEVGSDEKSVITAAGGPAIRLIIVSPIDGAVVFNVPQRQAAEFEAKLKQAASQTTKA